jgi:hypothetical protein
MRSGQQSEQHDRRRDALHPPTQARDRPALWKEVDFSTSAESSSALPGRCCYNKTIIGHPRDRRQPPIGMRLLRGAGRRLCTTVPPIGMQLLRGAERRLCTAAPKAPRLPQWGSFGKSQPALESLVSEIKESNEREVRAASPHLRRRLSLPPCSRRLPLPAHVLLLLSRRR